MTILDLSSNTFLEAGERVLQDRPTILAYLEDLQQSGEEVRLSVQGHGPLPAKVVQVADLPSKFKVLLDGPWPEAWRPGLPLVLVFSLDGIRLRAEVRVLAQGGVQEAFLAMPERVGYADRRTRMRAHFHLKEKATVTVLEGLLGARGATGHLLDLSMEGLKMTVDRALTLQGQASVIVSEATFAPGTHFPILRLDQLPYAPIVVGSGVLAHASRVGGTVVLGIRFEALGEMETQVLRQILGRRLPKFCPGFPVRKRPRDVLHGLEPAPGGRPGLEPDPDTDPVKASKRILVVAHDDLDRTILVAALANDGYQRIHEARSCPEAMNHLKAFPMDLLILAEQVGPEPAADFLARLQLQGLCETVPKILLADHLDVRTRALAHRSKLDHVHLRRDGYEGEFRQVLVELLGL